MRALPAVEVPGLPRFTGGAVGYLGYDLVRTVERLPRPPADTLAIPDAMLLVADTVVILDNLFGRAIVVANVEVPPGAAASTAGRRRPVAPVPLPPGPQPRPVPVPSPVRRLRVRGQLPGGAGPGGRRRGDRPAHRGHASPRGDAGGRRGAGARPPRRREGARRAHDAGGSGAE